MKTYHRTKILLTWFLILLSTGIFAQENPKIKGAEIKAQVAKEDMKEFKSYLRKADALYSMNKPGSYQEAAKLYLKAYSFLPDNAALNYKTGISLLHSGPKQDALAYLQMAKTMNPYLSKDILYYIARAYHFSWNFDSANYFYDEYFSTLKPKQQKRERTNLEYLKRQCSSGKELMKMDTNVIITNMGSLINSEYDDYNPIFSVDESEMYFTSRRPFNEKSPINDLDYKYMEDIYVSFMGNDKKWTEAFRINEPLNSEYNDAAVALSLDGQELFLYRGNKDFGSFYKTSLKGDKWKTPAELSGKYNSEYHESSLTYSFDNKLMFLISDDPNKGIGGKDIYISKFNGKTWSKPENLGPVINTFYDEEGIYFAPDNKTLYFSSKGHNSIGGYDVFKSEMRADGIWTAPINIGIPINTPYDDLFFKPSLNGKFAYYASVNDSLNYGGLDIYEVFFFIPKPLIQSHEDNLIASQLIPAQETMVEKTVEIKTIRLTIVEGNITSSTGEAVEAMIEITNLTNNTKVSETMSNSASGKYVVTLLPGNNYSMNVKAGGYLFHSENFNIPDTTGYQKVKIDIELQKVAIGAKVVLKNVFFDTGKATLRSESFDELERLITFMNENPTVKVEIGGHTDNIGSFASNQKLSKDRAQAVVDYLLLKAVNPDRLESVGYSSSKPIADNKTNEGRQQNRRVEARIIGY